MNFSACRTDLAHEANARLSSPHEGIKCSDSFFHNIPVSLVSVTSAAASEAIGKPIGDYYTLSLTRHPGLTGPDFKDNAYAVSEVLRKMPVIARSRRFLIACLGNIAITPDSLGPLTADALIVTRHLKASLPEDFELFSEVSVVKPGVLGTTGVESGDTIDAISSVVRPDCVIAVDALCAGEFERLCRTIQICDSGICPGSGVKNDRKAINDDTLGLPVVAVGVPTVIDASAFSDSDAAKGLFVTPRNIDELVKSCSRLIAAGINLALHPELGADEVLSLMQ